MTQFRSFIIRPYHTSAKSAVILTSYLHEVIIGCMLGDLHAENPRDLFYGPEGIKQVSVNLSDHFTAVSLAY